MEKYVYGSSAYKIEEYEYVDTQEQIKRQQQQLAAQRRKEALYRKFVASMIVYGIVIFMLAAGTVYSRVLVMQAETVVHNKQEQLHALTEENNNKKIKIEQSIDLKKIEELAITQYGMQRPDNNQTIYISVVQDDYGEVVQHTKAKNKILASIY